MPKFLKRLLCRHRGPLHILAMNWRGETIAVCPACGALKRKPMPARKGEGGEK